MAYESAWPHEVSMWANPLRRLAGDLVILEPLTRDHADGLFEAARPSVIWEWWPFNPAVNRRTFDSWLDDALHAYGRRNSSSVRNGVDGLRACARQHQLLHPASGTSRP